MDIWGKRFLGREDSYCKGFTVRVRLVYVENRKGIVVRLRVISKRLVRVEVWEGLGCRGLFGLF